MFTSTKLCRSLGVYISKIEFHGVWCVLVIFFEFIKNLSILDVHGAHILMTLSRGDFNVISFETETSESVPRLGVRGSLFDVFRDETGGLDIARSSGVRGDNSDKEHVPPNKLWMSITRTKA